MNESIQVPTPDETGNTRTQVASTDSAAPEPQTNPFPQAPLVGGIEGLADRHARALGNEAASIFVKSTVNHLHQENVSLKGEASGLRTRLDEVITQLHESELKRVRVETQLENERGQRHLRHLGVAVGTGLVSYAITLYTSDLKNQAYVVGFLGILILVFCWWPFGKERAP